MKGGYQYLFRVVLTQQGITFLADQTETVSLNNQTDEMKESPWIWRTSYSTLICKHDGTLFLG